ncbi:MAG: hypothetical protein HZA54_08220 [Planctomycetes bacterium]|nr:hypothetical protein [Planctomycetota bacterium]
MPTDRTGRTHRKRGFQRPHARCRTRARTRTRTRMPWAFEYEYEYDDDDDDAYDGEADRAPCSAPTVFRNPDR